MFALDDNSALRALRALGGLFTRERELFYTNYYIYYSYYMIMSECRRVGVVHHE